MLLARLPAIGSPGERPFADPEIDRERACELSPRYMEARQRFDRTALERAFSRVWDTSTAFWPSAGRLRQAALTLIPSVPDQDAARRREADAPAEA